MKMENKIGLSLYPCLHPVGQLNVHVKLKPFLTEALTDLWKLIIDLKRLPFIQFCRSAKIALTY